MASIKRNQVTFKNHGQVTGHYPLTRSHFDSLDNESYFTHGNPTQAEIIGPVGAQCTFFDDQQYRTGENALTISLKRQGTASDPVVVDLAYNRLGPGDHNNGIYSGELDSFGWILSKHAEASWVENVLRIAGKFTDILDSAAGSVLGSWVKYIDVAGQAVKVLDKTVDNSGRSDNSRVDNVSSVLFGALDE